MQTDLDKAAAIGLAVFVKMSWGSSEERYCSWSSDLTISGLVYTSEPSLDVTLGKRHGGLDENPATITADSRIEPFATIVSGYCHAPVAVEIGIVNPADTSQFRVVWRGNLSRCRKNFAGTQKLVRASVNSRKTRMKNVRLGYFTSPTCQNRFGDHVCGIDLATKSFAATVVSVGFPTPNAIQVNFSGSPTISNEAFRRGYISWNGLTIMIRSISGTSPTTIELVRIPVPGLSGEAITVIQGCDKQLTRCQFYENEANFQAPGLTIPPYNPALEIGP